MNNLVAELEDAIREAQAEVVPWSNLGLLKDANSLRTMLGSAYRSAYSEIVTPLQSADMILELGAGTGDLSELLPADLSKSYVQLNGSDLYCRVNAERHPEATVLCGDASRLPMVNESVDHVVALNLYDMLDAPKLVMAEIARVLRPGGYFIHIHDLKPNLYSMQADSARRLLVMNYTDGYRDGMTAYRVSDLKLRLKTMEPGLAKIVKMLIRQPLDMEELHVSAPELSKLISLALSQLPRLRREQLQPTAVFRAEIGKVLRRAGFEVQTNEGRIVTSLLTKRELYMVFPQFEALDNMLLGQFSDELDVVMGGIPNWYKATPDRRLPPIYDPAFAFSHGPDAIHYETMIQVTIAQKQ